MLGFKESNYMNNAVIRTKHFLILGIKEKAVFAIYVYQTQLRNIKYMITKTKGWLEKTS